MSTAPRAALLLSSVCLIGIAGLPRAASAGQPPADAAKQPDKPSAPETLPSVKEVLSKYVKALGGEDAIRKHTSRVDKGSMTAPNTEGKIIVYSAAPDKRANILTVPQGEMKQGYNGQKAWEVSPMGARFVEGEALAQQARSADFYQALNFEKTYDVKVVSAETFEGKKAYRLSFIPKADAGNPNSTGEQFMIFDADTGLLIGRVGQRQTPNGPVKLETSIAEYKEFGGIKVPTKLTTRFPGGQQELIIDTVEFDTVPDNAFDVPGELQDKK